jgi:excinuclease ABC subunit A
VLAPLIKGRKGFHTEVAKWAEKKGYPLLRVDGKWIEPGKFKALDRYVEHTISVELGRFGKKQPAPDRRRLVDAALALGRGTLYVARCARTRNGLQHAAFLSRHGPLLRRA